MSAPPPGGACYHRRPVSGPPKPPPPPPKGPPAAVGGVPAGPAARGPSGPTSARIIVAAAPSAPAIGPPPPPGQPALIRARIIVAGRPEAQTAIALLDTGDLRGAARILEHSGAHASAAVIRLEHAAVITSNLQRIAMLREGCARNSGATEEGRSLHRALGEALLRQIEVLDDGAPRRALMIEAARAFEEADEGALAGELYERLGLWRRSAHAYERAGAVDRLEYVLAVIERQEAAQAAIQAAIQAVDEALRLGRRRLAHSLLVEHSAERTLATGQRDPSARLGLAQRLAALEESLPRGTRLRIGWGGDRTTTVHGAAQLRVGRAPDVELPLTTPGLSREHVVLRLAPRPYPAPPGLALVAVDQGSRVGSFWNGEALVPGEAQPLEGPGELGLGYGASVEVHPLHDPHGPVEAERGPVCGALLRPAGAREWTLFIPDGGPLALSPDHLLPLHLRFAPPHVELAADPEVRLRLAGTALEPGARVEALLGDRLELLAPGAAPLALHLRPDPR